jgi:hypothetical protein
MVTTKLLGLWLFVVGLLWTFGFVWFHLSMMTMTEPVLPLPLALAIGFAGPFVLIVGATLLMALWHTRIGSILVLLACAWLTWAMGPDCISGIIEPRQPLEAHKPYVFLVALLVFVLLADIAAVAAFFRCRTAHLTSR